MREWAQQQRADKGPVLAIGLYIGALLSLYGLILIIYGWLGSPDNAKSLGHPFDIWWGAVMLAVGLLVGALAFAGKRASDRAAANAVAEEPHRLPGSYDRDQRTAA